MNRIPKQLAITASLLLLSVFPAMSKAQNKRQTRTRDSRKPCRKSVAIITL